MPGDLADSLPESLAQSFWLDIDLSFLLEDLFSEIGCGDTFDPTSFGEPGGETAIVANLDEQAGLLEMGRNYGQARCRPPKQDSFGDAMDVESTAFFSSGKQKEVPEIEIPSPPDAHAMDVNAEEAYLTDASVAIVEVHEFAKAVRNSRRVAAEPSTEQQPIQIRGQEDNNRALRATARTKNTHLVQQLLDFGANMESRSESGMAALHAAIFYGQAEVVSMLVRAGADLEAPVHGTIEIRFQVGQVRKVAVLVEPRPIHLAAAKEQLEIVRILLTSRAMVDSRDRYRTTPLMLAAHLGFRDIARMLLDWRANTGCMNLWGKQPMAIATKTSGGGDMIKMLRKAQDEVVSWSQERERQKRTASAVLSRSEGKQRALVLV